MKQILRNSLLALILVAALNSCKKNTEFDSANFPTYLQMSLPSSNFPTIAYNLTTAATGAFKIPVAISRMSTVDRTFTIQYTSSTGAVRGTHYTAPTSITIKANQVFADTISIQGIYAQYSNFVRKDSLKISFVPTAGVGLLSGAGEITLIISRPNCPVVITSFARTYPTNEYTTSGGFSYGPYTTTVSNIVMVPGSMTKASCRIANVYDWGWSPLNAEFDWTISSNFKVNIPYQPTNSAGGSNPSFVEGSTVRQSKFSACDGTITLYINTFNATGGAADVNYEIRMN